MSFPFDRWPQQSASDRFDQWWIPEPNSGCWLWFGAAQGPDTRYAYGAFRLAGKNIRAHRFSYERACGPIPKGLSLDHLCRNPYCVNPDHLEAVTHAENLRRAPAFQGTHCRKCGTEFHSRWKRSDGRPRKECPLCVSEGKKQYYLRNFKRLRERASQNYHRKKRKGVSDELSE